MLEARPETPEAAAIAVLDRFMAALNAGDQPAMAATLHFPHYRLTQGRLQIWQRPEDYTLDGFRSRAGEGWARSAWDFRTVVGAGPEKVHLDVQFTRYRADGSVLGRFRSLWVVACLDGRWGAQLRSSFAA
ncbi:hypothetical protein ACFQY5_25200 [Paeniroseomonas aquatica]|uniref:DUF4440 domain-containing protein n=1 Tax=Paeniroseomonas aquatica TaxID=373043 RepID=A0ABT8A9F1_9PROT|nr:hypothetical protein [Paeniroseomonas aquatica]MDN3566329.1 hypothetical protein [Paeniroseomonas aquatica]